MAEPAELNALSHGRLPALVGLEILEMGEGRAASRLEIRPELLAPNGFLHAGTVVTLADTTCGYGSTANLPAGGTGFTTLDLSANFIGTSREGVIGCVATMSHGGRTTQVWDAEVTDERSAKVIALFRCTQMVLYGG